MGFPGTPGHGQTTALTMNTSQQAATATTGIKDGIQDIQTPMVKRHTFNESPYVSLNDYDKLVKTTASLAYRLNQTDVRAKQELAKAHRECRDQAANLARLLEEAKAIIACGDRLALLCQYRLERDMMEGAKEDLGVLVKEYLSFTKGEENAAR